MEETFIPESTSELYQKMISDTFRGNLNYSEDSIIWNVSSEFILKVCINKIRRRDDSYWIEGYIEIYFVGNDGREEYITHYHPAGEEIYNELCKINDGTYIFIRKKNTISGELKSIISQNEYNPQKYKNTRFTKYDIYYI